MIPLLHLLGIGHYSPVSVLVSLFTRGQYYWVFYDLFGIVLTLIIHLVESIFSRDVMPHQINWNTKLQSVDCLLQYVMVVVITDFGQRIE